MAMGSRRMGSPMKLRLVTLPHEITCRSPTRMMKNWVKRLFDTPGSQNSTSIFNPTARQADSITFERD